MNWSGGLQSIWSKVGLFHGSECRIQGSECLQDKNCIDFICTSGKWSGVGSTSGLKTGMKRTLVVSLCHVPKKVKGKVSTCRLFGPMPRKEGIFWIETLWRVLNWNWICSTDEEWGRWCVWSLIYWNRLRRLHGQDEGEPHHFLLIQTPPPSVSPLWRRIIPRSFLNASWIHILQLGIFIN